MHVAAFAYSSLTVRMVPSKGPVGVAIAHDGLLHADKRLQHSLAVVAVHVGDDGVCPWKQSLVCARKHIARRGESASNEGILAAAHVKQHTGMRHLAAPLQEHGAV